MIHFIYTNNLALLEHNYSLESLRMKHRDGSNKTGCFNSDCPGFVPAAGAVLQPGAVIDPVSDNGVLQNITFKVFMVGLGSLSFLFQYTRYHAMGTITQDIMQWVQFYIDYRLLHIII